jgi:hypothetical protein
VNAPVLSPAHETEPRSRLARANEARGRKVVVVDVSHLGLTREADKHVAKIAFRVNAKGEEERCIIDAWKRIEAMAKGSSAMQDPDLMTESKLCHALWNACRDVNEDGTPAVSGVFPSPAWMLANLDGDELAALLNIYNDVRFRKSTTPYEFTDDEVERVAMLCADGADTEIPTAMLAGMPREIIAQYVIVLSCKLRMARTELLKAQALAEAEEPADEAAPEEPSQ